MSNSDANTISKPAFPPVVAVLGHVDHGKTTLLDAIRETSVATREKGGITQKIGASSVEIVHDGQKRKITFIDTPGHEAFTKMRGRGAQAADIGLLIISLADSVKPQTRESIKILQESKTPFIVVLTKSDLPDVFPDKSKKDLIKEGIMVEGYGGDIPVMEVSAKTGSNIKELLDLILLMFDMHKSPEYSKTVSSSAPLQAIVIEAKLDPRAGSKATVVVKNGQLKPRDVVKIDSQIFKVRMIADDNGKNLLSATVGDAVELFGFEKVPQVGSVVTHESASNAAAADKEAEYLAQAPRSKEAVYMREEAHAGISVLLIADTQGSLEAIVNALPEGIKIASKKTGEVTDADIILAKSTSSIILSFNTKLKTNIITLAMSEKVLLRNYEVIYELLDEIKDAQEGKLLSQMEKVYGTAKVLAKFPYEKTFAFGVSVTEGRIAKGDRIRAMRGEEVLGETSITSLRVGKNPTSKVESGNEAGAVLNNPLDIRVGDVILSHS
ncbi:MAG TPA: translation initiation factor IF-2 [Candidatus Limnocylindrales bacterium]|nr:translation initiation factor IF-2 [Candidatus Limnocylindrales bacterium]